MQRSYVESISGCCWVKRCISSSGGRFLSFLTILLDNFRCILHSVGTGPNLRTQSKRLNMERPSRGYAQMLARCSSAPAAPTSQLGDKQPPPPPSPKKHPLLYFWPCSQTQTFMGLQESCSAPPSRRHWAWAGAPAQSHIHCWQVRHPSSSSPGSSVVGFEQKAQFQWCQITFHWETISNKEDVFTRSQKNVAITNGLSFLPVSCDILLPIV